MPSFFVVNLHLFLLRISVRCGSMRYVLFSNVLALNKKSIQDDNYVITSVSVKVQERKCTLQNHYLITAKETLPFKCE